MGVISGSLCQQVLGILLDSGPRCLDICLHIAASTCGFAQHRKSPVVETISICLNQEHIEYPDVFWLHLSIIWELSARMQGHALCKFEAGRPSAIFGKM